jgi:DNA-binding MurR/RpiR family transcriptional regulator
MNAEKEADVTFTLRLSPQMNQDIKELAQEMDVSQNSLIRTFIGLGMKSYREIILHQKAEFCRFLSQIQQDSV